MKDSLLVKLDHLAQRAQVLTQYLSDAKIIANQSVFQKYSKEYAQLEPVVSTYQQYLQTQQELLDNKTLLAAESDEQMQALLKEEIALGQQGLVDIQSALEILLLPKDPDDERPVFLEIRAGTGGDEAALFAGDLFRMYTRYCDQQSWRYQVVNAHEAERGGYKEVVLQIHAEGAYGRLKFESGAHRVQRVPITESSGRIHTSACTVAVLAVPDEVTEVVLDPSDLRIDTFRASGAGGQHVNTTDSAIRITHVPTGVVVECQDERSQHQNKAKAMVVLQAKIMQKQKDDLHEQQTNNRRNLVGSGDRSDRIRTYNFPQKRVTDHRIGLTLYALSELLEGDLDCLVVPLQQEHQADLMAALNESE